MAKRIDRTGEVRYNNFGSRMTIVKYTNRRNIIVEFEDGYKKETQYPNFINGKIKNPYDKTVCGVGFIGEGKYNPSINGHDTKEYSTWIRMIERCYSGYIERYPTYVNCEVCKEWHNFQNFAKWYNENYYEIKNETMHLDKDILVKGNKIYSPNTCIFVPQTINGAFVKHNKGRGKFPIGVSKYQNKYEAKCIYNGKSVKLGIFNTVEEAFMSYKKFKEKYMKEIADRYKENIPYKLYKALYDYKVDITD